MRNKELSMHVYMYACVCEYAYLNSDSLSLSGQLLWLIYRAFEKVFIYLPDDFAS